MTPKFTILTLLILSLFSCSESNNFLPDETGTPPSELEPKESPLLIGRSKINITPPVGIGIELSGYSSRWGIELAGIHDSLYARTIAIYNGSEYFIEITTDLLSTNNYWVQDLLSRLNASGYPLTIEHLMLTASHNHAGPSVGIPEERDTEYPEDFLDKIYLCALNALSGMEAGYIQVSKVNAGSDLFMNRQLLHPEGGCQIHNNPDGFSDKEILIKEYFNNQGHSIASSFVVGVHSTVMGEHNFYVSGDFAGAASRYVETSKANDHVSQWMMGGGGDQSPRHWHQHTSAFQDNDQNPDAHGEELALLILEGMESGMRLENPNTQSIKAGIDMPLLAGSDQTIGIYITQLNKDAVIIGTPFELFSKTVYDIKLESPFEYTYVYSMTNNAHRYLPIPETYGLHCYEENSSKFSDAAEPLLRSEINSLLHDLKFQ